MFPAVGPALVNLFDKTIGGRPFGDRVTAPASVTALARSVYGTVEALVKMGDEDKDLKSSDVRDVLSFVVLGVPWGGAILAPLVRPIGYGAQWGLGEIEPTGPIDIARGLLSGRASEASKR